MISGNAASPGGIGAMVVAGGGAELFGKEPAIEEAHADSSMADAKFFLFFREERVLQLFREHLFQVVVVAVGKGHEYGQFPYIVDEPGDEKFTLRIAGRVGSNDLGRQSTG